MLQIDKCYIICIPQLLVDRFAETIFQLRYKTKAFQIEFHNLDSYVLKEHDILLSTLTTEYDGSFEWLPPYRVLQVLKRRILKTTRY